jgi:hypothetical protein
MEVEKDRAQTALAAQVDAALTSGKQTRPERKPRRARAAEIFTQAQRPRRSGARKAKTGNQEPESKKRKGL